MSLLEAIAPALVGSVDGPVVVGWVIVAALVVTVGFVLFPALGPGTQPYLTEEAEPTPTDDGDGRDTNGGERSETSTESGSH